MRSFALLLLVCLGAFVIPVACVDSLEQTLRGTVDVIVVDGTITNLAEPQIIRLNRSKADPLTGRPGSVPVTKAKVEVVVDSSQTIIANETEEGRYQLPSDFQGHVGGVYQLRFTLSDGTRYQSTQQTMQSAPLITKVNARFNPISLSADELNSFTAAHDLFIETQDPANQPNYYRWDWRLWESQDWCKSCVQGRYSVNNVLTRYASNGLQYYETGNSLFEDCFYPPSSGSGGPRLDYFIYDYPCRTRCWAVLSSTQLNVFSDIYSNGGLISNRKVAQIPFYQRNPCLVEVRQSALTPAAYQFYQQLTEQTQRPGGVTDAPPTASVGNVQNEANENETVVGIFTASAVATVRHWLDRKDALGVPPGLFEILNGRTPNPEPNIPGQINQFQIFWTYTAPPFTAICSPTDSRTPFKPEGWRD